MMRAWRESFQKIDAKGKWENTTKARKKHVCAWLRLRATGMPGGACAQAASCFLLPRYDEVGRCSGVVRELDYRLLYVSRAPLFQMSGGEEISYLTTDDWHHATAPRDIPTLAALAAVASNGKLPLLKDCSTLSKNLHGFCTALAAWKPRAHCCCALAFSFHAHGVGISKY